MKRNLSYLLIVILLIVGGRLSSQDLSFIRYRLQVIVDGEYQIKKTGDLNVKIYDGSTVVYEENHPNLKTNTLALINFKLGNGTKLSSGENFVNLDWLSKNFEVEFMFNSKLIVKNSKSKTALKSTPYAIMALRAKYINTLQSKISDTIYLKEDIDFITNDVLDLAANVKQFKPQKSLTLPSYNATELLNIPSPKVGSLVLYATEDDTSIVYYDGKWNPIKNGNESIVYNGTAIKNFMIESDQGNMIYKTNSIDLVKGEEFKFSMEYNPSSDSLIYYESSNPEVVSLSDPSALSNVMVTATVNGYGSALITGKSKSGRLVKSFYAYIENTALEDPWKIYHADISSRDGAFQLGATEKVPARYVFYATHVVTRSKVTKVKWKVVPPRGGDQSRIYTYSADSAMVVFRDGTGEYKIQLWSEVPEGETFLSSMKFRVNMLPGYTVDSRGYLEKVNP